MLTLVNRDKVTLSKENKIIGEASTMGLQPGEWPIFIAIVDNRNEGFLFQRSFSEGRNGEPANFHYFSKEGYELIVLND